MKFSIITVFYSKICYNYKKYFTGGVYMDYIECCKRYDSAMKLSDSMGLNYLTNVDLDVCNYVYKQLSYIDFSRFSSGKPISLEKLIDDSVKEISLFGEDISSLVLDIVNNTLINSKVSGDITQFSTCISYDKENGEVIPRGSVYSYNIPDSLYEYSVYIFSHEHLHALKETRYLEWKDSNIIGEVIPLFYELVISSEEDILKKQLLTARLNDLFYNGCEFELTNDLIKTEKENNLYLYV